ncbi:MAG: DUF998 domain-containing protein [Chloroflexi bacterium]|nr:MAG: DUF998 domain-containing protein [Chloroflexota bacterium]
MLTGGGQMATTLRSLREGIARNPRTQRLLLACGIVASGWWVAIDVVGSLRYAGYSYVDQTISELTAEGAPTRTFMTVVSGVPYVVFMVAFGVGVWMAAGGRRAGRIAGVVLSAEALWGFAGGLAFPMAMRGVEATPRNEMHAVYGIGMPILFLVAIGCGSRLLGGRFRAFSYVAIAVMLVAGILMMPQVAHVATNEPTPWLGIEERTNAYAAMLWIAVFAAGLLRATRAAAPVPDTVVVAPQQVRPLQP